jgi:hypothetical protein
LTHRSDRAHIRQSTMIKWPDDTAPRIKALALARYKTDVLGQAIRSGGWVEVVEYITESTERIDEFHAWLAHHACSPEGLVESLLERTVQ